MVRAGEMTGCSTVKVARSKLHRTGNSRALVIPRKLLARLMWSSDDMILMRVNGRVLTAERIPVEQLAAQPSRK